MYERICLTRSNWQEERRKFGDDVRGILRPSRCLRVAATGGALSLIACTIKREAVEFIRSSETQWLRGGATCLELLETANNLATSRLRLS
jgi:hypothetical protein